MGEVPSDRSVHNLFLRLFKRPNNAMSSDDLNIGYLGYSEVTKEILDALSFDPALTISFHETIEAEYGRGVTYEEYDPWIKVGSMNSRKAIDSLSEHDIDILLVMGWPELLDEAVFSIPSIGCVGRHLSLLPARRGRAPVAWALIHGLDRTGVSLFWIDEGVDSGPIIGQELIEIDRTDHAQDLHDKCTDATITLLEDDVLPRFFDGDTSAVQQNHEKATYTHPRRPDMGLIDWTDSAWDIHNFIRGQSHPYPGAFTYYEMEKITAWYSQVDHETVTKASPGTVVDVGEDHNELVVQCGEGTVTITVEYTRGATIPTTSDRLGATPY